MGLSIGSSFAMDLSCRPVLWPSNSQIMHPPQGIIDDLQQAADKLLLKDAHPVSHLASAGKSQINDSQLRASREAFKDADRAAVLALAYHVTHQVDYFNASRNILIQWAKMNVPTGNPIDETRLEGMLWAYDLIACSLTPEENVLVLNWFRHMRSKKMAWVFGPITNSNNHRVHQLKMLLILDEVIGSQHDVDLVVKDARRYSTINLDNKTGASIDYALRSALYYHNYVMQPWLEIALVSHCCTKEVTQGFEFLSQHLLSDQIHGEFHHSTAKIDALRARGGFDYAKKNGTFDVTRAAATIVSYYTLTGTPPDPKLWAIVQQTKPSTWLTFLQARYTLWR